MTTFQVNQQVKVLIEGKRCVGKVTRVKPGLFSNVTYLVRVANHKEEIEVPASHLSPHKRVTQVTHRKVDYRAFAEDRVKREASQQQRATPTGSSRLYRCTYSPSGIWFEDKQNS